MQRRRFRASESEQIWLKISRWSGLPGPQSRACQHSLSCAASHSRSMHSDAGCASHDYSAMGPLHRCRTCPMSTDMATYWLPKSCTRAPRIRRSERNAAHDNKFDRAWGRPDLLVHPELQRLWMPAMQGFSMSAVPGWLVNAEVSR